jgi:DNA repair exonuclease SbcCD nuclease subunit
MQEGSMSKELSQIKIPIAVLIADVHYNVHTLPLADAAMRMAINKSKELNIPLIVAGDLHDTKANMRGEVVAAMLKTFTRLTQQCYILRGNHDQINEKSKEHSLEFLRYVAGVYIIDSPIKIDGQYLIPYHHDVTELQYYLKTIPQCSRLIMHQGITGSNSGEYYQDKSAIAKEDLADFRVISGHYHARQDIKCGRPQKSSVGLASYIGNPYTLGFGEANDPEKGFQILYDDGILEFVPTNLRKHVVIDVTLEADGAIRYSSFYKINPEDLVWVKVKGTKEELSKISKSKISRMLGKEDFRLDLIPLETKTDSTSANTNISQHELLDNLIESVSNTSDSSKAALKDLWRLLML